MKRWLFGTVLGAVIVVGGLVAGYKCVFATESQKGVFQGISIKNDTVMVSIGDTKEKAKEISFLKLDKDKHISDDYSIDIECINNGSSEKVQLDNFINDLAIGVTNITVDSSGGKVKNIKYSFAKDKLESYKNAAEKDKVDNILNIKRQDMKISNNKYITTYSYTSPKGSAKIYGINLNDDVSVQVEKFDYSDGKIVKAKDNIQVDGNYMNKFQIILSSGDYRYQDTNQFFIEFKTEGDMKSKSDKFVSNIEDKINQENEKELSEPLKVELLKDKLIPGRSNN